MSGIDDRKRRILQAIIDDYIKKLKEEIKYKKEVLKNIQKEIADCENKLNIISNLK